MLLFACSCSGVSTYPPTSSRERQHSSRGPSEEEQKAQGLRWLSSFLCISVFSFSSFPLNLSVNRCFFIFFLFNFYFCCHLFPVSLRPSFLSVSIPYTIGSVICLEPPWTWDGYNSTCVFSISPRVAIFPPSQSVCLSCPAALPVFSPPSSSTLRAFQKSHKSFLPCRRVVSSV